MGSLVLLGLPAVFCGCEGGSFIDLVIGSPNQECDSDLFTDFISGEDMYSVAMEIMENTFSDGVMKDARSEITTDDGQEGRRLPVISGTEPDEIFMEEGSI